MMIFGLSPSTIQKYQDHKITEPFRLEGTSGAYLIQSPPLKKGHLEFVAKDGF